MIVLCVPEWGSLARLLVIVEPRAMPSEQYIHISSVDFGDFSMESKI